MSVLDPFICFGFVYRVSSVPVVTSASVAISAIPFLSAVAGTSESMLKEEAAFTTITGVVPISHATKAAPFLSLIAMAPRPSMFNVGEAVVFVSLNATTKNCPVVYAVKSGIADAV